MKYHYQDSTMGLVEEFHEAMRLGVADEPVIPDERTCLLRLHLLQEELSELALGMYSGNLVECLDALADLRYVLDGTVLAMGMQDVFMQAFCEVHNSNMTKLDENGQPYKSENDRIIKGPNYRPPDLKRILADAYPEMFGGDQS